VGAGAVCFGATNAPQHDILLLSIIDAKYIVSINPCLTPGAVGNLLALQKQATV
jgi:hypothetical protein